MPSKVNSDVLQQSYVFPELSHMRTRTHPYSLIALLVSNSSWLSINFPKQCKYRTKNKQRKKNNSEISIKQSQKSIKKQHVKYVKYTSSYKIQ